MVTLHFAWYLLHLAMFAFHFAYVCHILAFQPLICMVFPTFSCFKRSCGSPSNARLHDWPWQPKQRQPRQQAPQSLARIRREPNPSGANGHGNAAKMLVWQGRLEHQVANRIERPTSGNFCTAHCSVCPRISRWRLEPLAPWPSPHDGRANSQPKVLGWIFNVPSENDPQASGKSALVQPRVRVPALRVL